MIVDRFLQVFKVKLTGERLFRVYGSEKVPPLPLTQHVAPTKRTV